MFNHRTYKHYQLKKSMKNGRHFFDEKKKAIANHIY